MATSLTFGNHLKFGQDSLHTSKGRQIPSSTEREGERAPEALHEPHHYQEGPPTGPVHVGASPRCMVERRPIFNCSWPDIDKLATSLGINESLAFRAFDKAIIFGNWLSKTRKLALASGAFLFEKGFYYILVDYFQKNKNVFQKGV